MRRLFRLIPALLAVAVGWSEDAKPADGGEKPAAAKPADPPKPTFTWVDATNDLGGSKWGAGGVTAVAVVPDSDQIIAAVAERWLWSSSNGGGSWTALGTVPNAKARPTQIVFDPKDPTSFWVPALVGSPGLFATTDGGKTFKGIANVDGAESVGIDFSDAKRKTMLVGVHEREHDVEYSSNSGGFFGKLSHLPSTLGFTEQVVVLDEKTWLVSAANWDKKQKRERDVGIWRTDDAGKTWAQVCKNGATAPALVTSGGAIFWPYGDAEGILRSVDKGRVWKALAGVKCGPMELPKGWIAAVGDQQILVSTDHGDTWDPVGEKLDSQPVGAAWCGKRHCFFAWAATAGQQRGALMRLDVPADLQELVSPSVARDVVVWDGDDNNAGTGWGGKDAIIFAPQTAVARQGHTALQWKVPAKTFFINAGWHWFPYPAKDTDGTDCSACKNLVLSVKCQAKFPLSKFTVGIGSPGKSGKDVDVLPANPKLANGDWHDIVVPLSDLQEGGVDLKKLTDVRFTANNGNGEFDFDMYIDNIGFAK
jgi:hypothetical protein